MKKLKNKKIFVLSNFTFQTFKPYVEDKLKNFNINAKINVGEFNQIDQELFNKKNKNLKNSDLIIIAVDFNYLYPNNEFNLSKISTTEIVIKIKNWIYLIRKSSNAKILIWDFVSDTHSYNLLINPYVSHDNTYIIDTINQKIKKIITKFEGVYLFEISKISKNYGIRNVFDKRYTYLARVPFSSEYYEKISFLLSRFMNSIFSTPKKCLVLDLDNTLWGGVLGEDDIDGIELGNTYNGVLFVDFQKYLLNLKKRGVLLAISSKNNLEDVQEVFKKHNDMILKLSDFVNIKVNWDDKYRNINNIANEIGIGLSSIVFFDDSKIEREAMKKLLPEVNTLDVEKDVSNYVDYIEDSGFFDNITFTKEDLGKTKKYLIRSKGSKLIDKFDAKDDFLKSLKMVSIIKHVNKLTLTRAAQLTNKTNQFNLNLKRYDSIRFKNLIKDKKKAIALTIQVKDKFGDHGIVGLAVAIKKNESTWEMDNFLLSCRVLGRDVEKSLLYQIIHTIKKKSKNIKFLNGYFKRGDRNNQVKNFYVEQKFIKKGSKFIYNLKKQNYKNTNFIKIQN